MNINSTVVLRWLEGLQMAWCNVEKTQATSSNVFSLVCERQVILKTGARKKAPSAASSIIVELGDRSALPPMFITFTGCA